MTFRWFRIRPDDISLSGLAFLKQKKQRNLLWFKSTCIYVCVCPIYIMFIHIQYTFICTYLNIHIYTVHYAYLVFCRVLFCNIVKICKDVDVHLCIYINSSEMYGMSSIFAVCVLLGFFQFGRTKLWKKHFVNSESEMRYKTPDVGKSRMFFHLDQILCTSFMMSLDSPRFAHYIWIHSMTLNRIKWPWNYWEVIRLESDMNSKNGIHKGPPQIHWFQSVTWWVWNIAYEDRSSHPMFGVWVFPSKKTPPMLETVANNWCFKMILGWTKSIRFSCTSSYAGCSINFGCFNHPHWLAVCCTWTVPFAPVQVSWFKSEMVHVVFYCFSWGRRSDVPFLDHCRKLRENW